MILYELKLKKCDWPRVLTIIIFLASINAFGQTTFTTNGAGTVWTNAANWSCSGCGLYPGQSAVNDIVIVNNTMNFTSGGSTITVGSITINNATLTVGGSNSLTAGSVAINGTGTGFGDFTIWGQSTGSPTVNITNNLTITKASTSASPTRLRVGSNGTYATTSTVNIGGNLIYNYNTGSNETNVEITIGNSSTQNDACILNVTGGINLVYNYANDVTSDYLELRIANNSKVNAGNLTVTAGGSATNQRCLVSLAGATTLLDLSGGASGSVNVSNQGVLSVSGSASTSGKLKAKSLNLTNGSMSVNGSATTLLEVSKPGLTAVDINGTTSTSELLIYEDADVNITGNVAITRNLNSTDNVRLRIGGTTTALTTSTVSVIGDMAFNYLNSSSSSAETTNEISVGNSTAFTDACQLNITGDVNLVYNFNGTQNSNVLSFEVGKASAVSMNNLAMEMMEGGSGVGCDIRIATNDNLGASITINGNATLKFNDGTPNATSDTYIKAGNDASTASTTITINGDLAMISNYAAATTNNTYAKVSGSSILTIGGDINFSASATTGMSVENRITLNDNAVLNLHGAILNPLQGSFDFTPNGTANGTIKFVGSVAQNFPMRFGTSSNNYKNVVIDNTSGVAFAIPLSTLNIVGSLTLTNGIINSSVSNTLVFEDGATCNGGSATSYVTGLVQKKAGTINNDLTLPLGSGVRWAPLELSTITGANATTIFSAEYFSSAYSDLDTDGTFDRVSDNEYWNVSVAGTVPSADVTLYWKNACFSEISADELAAPDLFIGRYNGTNWNKLTTVINSGSLGCPGSGSGSVTSTGLSTFNRFSFAHGSALLPIVLKYFKAELFQENYVKLKWESESEFSSDHYVVLRSNDAITFYPISKVKSFSGNTDDNQVYEVVDSAALLGINYYKLVQVDIDGAQKSFNIISFELEDIDSTLELYPNPVRSGGGSLYILNRNHTDTDVKILKIISTIGTDVTLLCPAQVNTQNEMFMDISPLDPGMYTIVLMINSSLEYLKFLVK